MADLAINALTAKTPVPTDLIPVADPTTGIAGKSTIQQSYNANIQSVSISYTGTAPPPFGSLVAPTCGVQVSAGLTIQNGGVTTEAIIFSNGSSTTLTSSNLAVVRGNLTMSTWPSLTSLSFPILTGTLGNFNPTIMNLLTTLSIPSLTYVGGAFQTTQMATLTTLSTPELSYCASSYGPNNMAALTTLSIPNLSYSGGFSPSTMNSLTTLSAPALTIVAGSFGPNSMSLLTTLSIPVLASVTGSFDLNNLPSLVTISAPVLTSIGARITLSGMAALTTVTLPVIETIGQGSFISINITSGSTAALSTFTLGSTLKRVEGHTTMTSCALTQASVDDILVRLAALDGTGGTTAYSTKTVTLTGTSATPSATGLAAKSTLVARGCTVTNN